MIIFFLHYPCFHQYPTPILISLINAEDYVPPLINLTVVAISHEDPSVDAVAPDTEISAFVADPLSQFGTTKIASAFTGPDGIAVLSVPHNQSLIITANLDGALVNSITTKANLKESTWKSVMLSLPWHF